MFELPPLLPHRIEVGRIQRQLAWQYGVQLIPRRKLLGVLAGEESTTDSIHLSPTGHQRMATCVWSIVSSAYE